MRGINDINTTRKVGLPVKMDGQSSLFNEWFQRYGLFSNHLEYALRYLEPQLEFCHRDGVGEPHWERDYKAQTRG